MQDADPDALSTLVIAYQDLVRDDLDVALVMAGLTHGVNRLLDRRLIDATGWGKGAFALPYLGSFLRGGRRITRIS